MAELSEQIRVLVVDDDALVRAGLTMILAGAGDVEIVGEAEQARAGAGDLRFRGGERGHRVAHLDGETVTGGAVEAQLDRGRGRVLARVGQRLLDDPQCVTPDRVGYHAQVGQADLGVDAHPGGA